jgi:hypothetical protein
MISELEDVCKEVVVAYFEALTRMFRTKTVDKYETHILCPVSILCLFTS